MTWQPGPRAQWAQDAIAGHTTLQRDPGPGWLDVDELLDDAVMEYGITAPEHAFGQDFVEPLEVFASALANEAQLHRLGRWATYRYLRRLLFQRLALTAWSDAHPAETRTPIEEPIFVLGAPRTGTTALFGALARLSGGRVPNGAEFLLPIPPVGRTHDDRHGLVSDEITYPQQVSTGLESIHAYSPEMPKECLSAMAFSARTEEFISRYNVPSYVSWLQSSDLTPAYDMHRLVLEVLSHNGAAARPDATSGDVDRRRWVLKSPVHLQGIPQLVRTYPDARFVVTHRNPASVLASVSSLIASLRWAFSDEVDPVAIGRYHLDLYSRSLALLADHADNGLLPPERTLHVHHADIVQGPSVVADGLLPDLGLETDPAHEARVAQETEQQAQTQAHEAAASPDPAHQHHYDAADFGLSALDVDVHFGRYLERFDVQR